ncbi:galactoside O-acetyltransferase [Colletotrichum graminicola]|uniref:Galactoside O-acetyltransferase n=1 Tax=Colletotrichum graminicola (strain M1.001 / M2 / FGSC 10212) TaxID=645133 RepID=E3QCD0_COLGM|nr:galactoside O-acetyltransferase [Colletotrichum graminicola M1.001]EFQ28518.1 galactoside O-acetyltransferase [Colletotrichum graminicola M1.001]WDK16010.1 galactoside O-acetyltransferase [Colletotrichum graminicola]
MRFTHTDHAQTHTRCSGTQQSAMNTHSIDREENRRRMRNGELYWAFAPDLIADRKRCKAACDKLNSAGDVSRRTLVGLWKDINGDTVPLPPMRARRDEDSALLENYPWIETPIKMDYGYNVKLGENVYIGSNSTWVDTCLITVGSRTIIGPNCCFYSGEHPLDPSLRNGTRGPESGKPITIGDDCYLGGNVIVLPGVTIGRGVTVGAGSVVTKDVPDYVCIAGNPARIIKKVTPSGDGLTPALSTNFNYTSTM